MSYINEYTYFFCHYLFINNISNLLRSCLKISDILQALYIAVLLNFTFIKRKQWIENKKIHSTSSKKKKEKKKKLLNQTKKKWGKTYINICVRNRFSNNYVYYVIIYNNKT